MGGDYSKWSVPFIPLAPRPLSSPISSPLFLLQETVYEGYLFLIESEKKGVGGGMGGQCDGLMCLIRAMMMMMMTLLASVKNFKTDVSSIIPSPFVLTKG